MKKTKKVICNSELPLTMEETEEVVFLPGRTYEVINSEIDFGSKTIVKNENDEWHILDEWSNLFEPIE